MPSYTPKHRAQRASRAAALGRHAAVAGAATAATAVVVGVGVAASVQPDGSQQVAALSAVADESTVPLLSDDQAEALRDREARASRSDRRTSVDDAKADALRAESASGGQVTKSKDLGSGDPRAIAQAMLPEFGFSSDQFGCLDALWTKESGWNVYADNPTSSAYGIPQALPGSKMSTAGADWATNPATQIRWGLGYISATYGSPCGAWSHSQSVGWY